MSDQRNSEFCMAAAWAQQKCGRELLTDSDLLLLACEEISRTTTYEELHYFAGKPCSK